MVYNINEDLEVKYENIVIINKRDHWYGYRRLQGEIVNLDSL